MHFLPGSWKFALTSLHRILPRPSPFTFDPTVTFHDHRSLRDWIPRRERKWKRKHRWRKNSIGCGSNRDREFCNRTNGVDPWNMEGWLGGCRFVEEPGHEIANSWNSGHETGISEMHRGRTNVGEASLFRQLSRSLWFNLISRGCINLKHGVRSLSPSKKRARLAKSRVWTWLKQGEPV